MRTGLQYIHMFVYKAKTKSSGLSQVSPFSRWLSSGGAITYIYILYIDIHTTPHTSQDYDILGIGGIGIYILCI